MNASMKAPTKAPIRAERLRPSDSLSTSAFRIHVVDAQGDEHLLPAVYFTCMATAFAWAAARWPDAQRVHIVAARPDADHIASVTIEPTPPQPAAAAQLARPRPKSTFGTVGLKSPSVDCDVASGYEAPRPMVWQCPKTRALIAAQLEGGPRATLAERIRRTAARVTAQVTAGLIARQGGRP